MTTSTTVELFHLWTWDRNTGEWQHTGSGTADEMNAALAGATEAATTLGLTCTYRVAAEKPEPLHAARRITINLPGAVRANRGGSALDTWLGPRPDRLMGRRRWRIERDTDGDLIVVPPNSHDVLSDSDREQWQSFALAVLAATGGVR